MGAADYGKPWFLLCDEAFLTGKNCRIGGNRLYLSIISWHYAHIQAIHQDMNTKANILVIEDHAVVQLGIRTLLSTCSGIDLIDKASSGTEALEKFSTLHFDLLLLDVELPDISGFDLLAKLRNLSPSVRVLFYSMHDEYWVVTQMLQAEADGIVMKSDRLDELRTAVEAVVAGGKYYSKEFAKFVAEYESQDGLTSQEQKVLRQIADGMTSQQIAENLFVSLNTVEFHRRRIMRKMGVQNMAELIKVAFAKGYLSSIGGTAK